MPFPVYLIATPIGDYMQDMSVSALHAIKSVRHLFLEADDGFAERLRTQGLLNHHHRVYFLSEPQLEQARELLQSAEPFALLASSGIPCFLDPGREIVELCLEHFADEVDLVPLGVSSALDAALCMCGLDLDLFQFNGHYPEHYLLDPLTAPSEVPMVYFVRGGAVRDFVREAWAKIPDARRLLLFKDVRKKQRARTYLLRRADTNETGWPVEEQDADYVSVLDRSRPR